MTTRSVLHLDPSEVRRFPVFTGTRASISARMWLEAWISTCWVVMPDSLEACFRASASLVTSA